MLAILVAIVVVGFGAGILLAVLDPHRSAGHHHSTVGRILGLSIAALVLAAAVIGCLLAFRRPGYRRVMQYGWRRRQRVVKALRRGQPLSAEDMPVAAAITDMQRKQWWWPLFYGVLVVIWALDALTRHGFRRWDAVGLAVLYVVLLPVIIWQRRKMLRNYDRLKGQSA